MRPELVALRRFIEGRWPDGAGPDPYDALNSRFIRTATLEWSLPRIVAIQLLRGSPWDPRGLLGIAPHANPKTLSLLVRAYLAIWRDSGDPAALDRARAHLKRLSDLATSSDGETAWGYSFAWQSSRLWLDREPSSVCTAFVAQAFLDAGRMLEDVAYRSVAHSASRFLVNRCLRRSGSTSCFSYVPGADVFVHNANVLSASIVAQVGALDGDGAALETASAAARTTVAAQHEDGSWTYDMTADGRRPLIDGFHTAFVIEALDRVGAAGAADCAAAIRRGLDFYRSKLIEDGRPIRSLARAAQTDIRDCAMALLILRRFAASPGTPEQIASVEAWTLATMRVGSYFIGEWGLPVRSRIAYPRWQAWMLLALAQR